MTKDEALKLALEALEKSHICPLLPDDCAEAITAIKEALISVPDGAQPEQEPVKFEAVWDSGPTNKDYEDAMRLKRLQQLTSPLQRKPLTDEEIRRANHHMVEGAYDYSFKQGVKWAEYKHSIKGEA